MSWARIRWFFLSLPFLTAAPLPAQTAAGPVPTASTPGMALSPVPTTGSPATIYDFNLDTVWAHLAVKVIPGDNGFGVKAESSAPLSGWILKDPSGNQVLSKGGSEPQSVLEFQVARAFQPGDWLTLFVSVDNEEMPSVLHLAAGATDSAAASSSDLPAGVEVFQEDSDRPYNKMVETLYNRAAVDYGKAQPDDALSLLKKAQELDPLQPQVQNFLDKVRLTLSSSGPKSDLSKTTSVDADVEKDFQTDDTFGSQKKTKLAKDESIASYFKTSETVKTPKMKKNAVKKLKKAAALSHAETQAEADQSYNLGLESYRAGNYADAKKYWEQTLSINPNHLQAQRNLTRLKAQHPELP